MISAGTQVGGSLLVGEAGHYERKNFPFARREKVVAPLQFGELRSLLPRDSILIDGGVIARSNSCSSNGFERNSIAPALMARTEEGISPCPEMKTMGGASPVSNCCWSSRPLDARKLQVQDQACRDIRFFGFQKFRSRSENCHSQSHGGNEAGQRFPYTIVVIHHEDNGALGIHDATLGREE